MQWLLWGRQCSWALILANKWSPSCSMTCSLGDSCYTLHFNLTSFSEAQLVCKAEGKILAEITSQQENDLISELLLASRLSASKNFTNFVLPTDDCLVVS